jgi:hypothetical protein
MDGAASIFVGDKLIGKGGLKESSKDRLRFSYLLMDSEHFDPGATVFEVRYGDRVYTECLIRSYKMGYSFKGLNVMEIVEVVFSEATDRF